MMNHLPFSIFPGLTRGSQDSFQQTGGRLPFRQLTPLNSDDKSSSESGELRQLHSGLQSSPPLGSSSKRRAGAAAATVVEPELLTTSQEIEVVLGDTTVLPCKVAHLGNFLGGC